MFQAHPKDINTILNRRWRLEHLYPIRTEERGLRTLRMDDRPIQNVLYKKAEERKFRGLRLITAKGRKQGVTTFWSLFYLDDTLWTPNTVSCILAHKEKDVKKIFRTVKTAYRYSPNMVRLADGRVWQKPKANYDNVNELIFDGINSQIYVALESRGETNSNLHVSEAAHIRDDEERMAATLESVPNRDLGSNVTVESTSNGVGGWFYDAWYDAEAGVNGFDPVFFPWFMKPAHRQRPPSDFVLTEEEKKLVADVAERYKVLLDHEQVYWWRMKKTTLKRLMPQEHPTFADESFLSSEGMVFDDEIMRMMTPRAPIRTTKSGIKIYVEPKPGRRYIIGADPAEGVGGDFSVVEVFDAVTLEQVAEYRNNRIEPGKFGEFIIPEAGRLFNNALAVIERNNHGHTVIDRCKPVYAHLYMQRDFDKKKNKKTKRIGWNQNQHHRNIMLDEYEELVNDGTVTVHSAILKSEMQTFVITEDGKREAKTGKHDDTVIASALAVKVAGMAPSSYGVYSLNS